LPGRLPPDRREPERGPAPARADPPQRAGARSQRRPGGDTPAAVSSYARIHRLLPQFRYLIGTRKELLPVWHAWHVPAVARDPDLVDHTAYTVLLDRGGRERAVYDARIHAQDVVQDVRLLLKQEDG
jgi:cytochrome oxidase Cu insertion factor (SCO1/SenC/PrrC family)